MVSCHFNSNIYFSFFFNDDEAVMVLIGLFMEKGTKGTICMEE